MKQMFRNALLCALLLLSSYQLHAVNVINGCTADYIIVGAGTAGAALAAKISDPSTGNSVLILEAGINRTTDPAVLASNIFATIPLYYDNTYSKTRVVNTIDDEQDTYTDGRMWGGSSAHNGLQVYRGTAVWDQMAAISGNPQWTYNNLLNNVFLPLEHYTPNGTIADPNQRGSDGPLFITQEPPVNGDLFMQAVRAGTVPNTPFVSDLNNLALGAVGVGANQDSVTPPYLGATSVRSFSGNSYLTGIPAVNTGGAAIPAIVDADGNGLNGRKLKIISSANVVQVIFNGTTAIGVEYILSDDRETVIQVFARKKVILCAGTIQSAAILQRSGIGDPTLLNSLEIPVIVANSNVGANLRNNVGPIGVFTGGNPVINTIPLPQLPTAMVDLSPSLAPAGVRRYQVTVTNGTAFFPPPIAQVLGLPPEGVTIIGTNITQQSTGTIAIVSKDPLIDPNVNFNLYSDGPFTQVGTDAYKAVQFYRTYLKNIETAVQASYPGAVIAYPTPAMYADLTDDQLFQAVLNTTEVDFHALGSASMAATIADGVVDGNLNVFGVSNLMVADNSVLPVTSEGNTQYPAYVIGLQAARIILGL